MGFSLGVIVANCLVCRIDVPVPHQHHVIPREYGGENGPTVTLCGDCHTKIHAEAESVLAYMNNQSNKVRRVWRKNSEAERAKTLVAAIVKSALNAGEKQFYQMHLKIDAATHNELKMFKQDNGFGSLVEAVLFCIRYTTNHLRGRDEIQKNKIGEVR